MGAKVCSFTGIPIDAQSLISGTRNLTDVNELCTLVMITIQWRQTDIVFFSRLPIESDNCEYLIKKFRTNITNN